MTKIKNVLNCSQDLKKISKVFFKYAYCTIKGTPVPLARARADFKNRCVYDPQKLVKEEFRKSLKVESILAADDKPLANPLCMRVVYHMGHHDRAVWHSRVPDLSNLIKFTEDCLNRLLWEDDKQIASIEAKKIYSEEPFTELEIARIQDFISWEKCRDESMDWSRFEATKPDERHWDSIKQSELEAALSGKNSNTFVGSYA